MKETFKRITKDLLRWADWLPSLDHGFDQSERNTVKLAVHSYCQTNWYCCGAAAGWAVVEALKPKASYAEFYGDCSPDPWEGMGMTESEIACALRRHGITAAYKRNMDFPDIRASIDKGYPLIVGVGFACADGDHRMVIYSYGHRPDRVYLANNVVLTGSHQRMGGKTFRDGWWNPTGAALVCSRNRKGVPELR
jgi:hypothetical protein